MDVYHDQRSIGLTRVTDVRVVRVGAAWASTGLRYCLTAVCAGSAGVHAALIQPHIAEAGLPLGSAFAVAVLALALAALAVRRPQNDSWAPPAATALLCVVAASYVLSRTTGLPLLVIQPEHVDVLGTATTITELAGAACGAVLMSRKDNK